MAARKLARDRVCGNCAAWNALTTEGSEAVQDGECRAGPPVAQMDDEGSVVVFWPITSADEWCQAHKGKN